MSNFVGTTAVTGIGATEFSKDSGRSEMSLATEACRAAIADAGLTPAEQKLALFSGPWNGSVDPVFREYAY